MHLTTVYSQELADHYDQRHFGGASGRFILRKDFTVLMALLPPSPALVLDIPCGTGIYGAGLANRGYKVLTADASWPMLSLALARQTSAASCLCTVHDLPLAESSIDATVTLRLFSHFDRHQIFTALCALRRTIRPGGRIIFDSFRWTPRRWPAIRRWMAQDTIYEMRPEDVQRIVHEAGLRVVAQETRYLFSPIWQRKTPALLLRALTEVENRLPDPWLLRTFWACTKAP